MFNTYFAQFPGKYFTGDGCKRDKDGYYQITGRVDDVINVSGHRMGTAEVESALVSQQERCRIRCCRLSAPDQRPVDLRVRNAEIRHCEIR